MGPAAILASRIKDLRVSQDGPLLVALDGRAAAGKSTLACHIAPLLEAAVIDADDFYGGGTEAEWDAMSPAEKADHCIDWRRQRPVLEALAQGKSGSWHIYDWEADDGSLIPTPTFCDPAPVIILEGAYSARPELADLFRLRVLLDASAEVRSARLIRREGEHSRDEWNARFEEGEQWYFTHVMPPDAFDVAIRST